MESLSLSIAWNHSYPQDLLIWGHNTINMVPILLSWRRMRTKNSEVTPMFRWTSLSTLFVALSSYGITLQEAQKAFLANVALVPSGSITYRIEFHRPKDNLLGALPGQEQLLPSQEQVPVIAGENDVTLAGVGSFKWKDEKFVARINRVCLSTLPDRLLSTEIHDIVGTWNGSISKYFSSRYSSPKNVLEETVSIADRGELLERYGVVVPRQRLLHLFFWPVGYYSSSVREQTDFFPSFSTATDTSNGLVELGGNPKGDIVTVDPSQGNMPVDSRMGNTSKQITYRKIDDVWFPDRMEGTWYDGDNEILYSITCQLVSYELNGDYPDSDFDFQFPAGTPVEDEIQGTEYIAGAN